MFIEENENFLDQIFKECGATNLGQYYNQFKVDKEKRQKDQHREEIKEKMKNSLLPDEMKRELISKEVEARFPNKRDHDVKNMSQNLHQSRQMFDKLKEVPRMPMTNQPQTVDFVVMRSENMSRPPQIRTQLPNQMQMDRQNQRQNSMNNQRMKQVPLQNPNQIMITTINKIPQQMNNQRVEQIGGQIHRKQIPQMQREPIRRDQISVDRITRNNIPAYRGGSFPNSSSNLAPNNIRRNVYNSPNKPQNNRGYQNQRDFTHSPQNLRNNSVPMQLPVRGFSFNQIKNQGRPQINHHNQQQNLNQNPLNNQFPPQRANSNQQIPYNNMKMEEDIGDENFFPK